MESSIILVIGLILLRAFLIPDIEEIIQTRTTMSGNGTHPNERHLKSKNAERIKVKIHSTARYLPYIFETYGQWYLESGYLIIFDAQGNKAAHKLPMDAKAITEEKL